MEDTIVKSQLLFALPANLRSVFVGHEDCTLEQYSKIADSMVAVTSNQSPDEFINRNSFYFSPGSPDFRRHNLDRNRHNYPQNFQEHISLRDSLHHSLLTSAEKYAMCIYSRLTELDVAIGQEINLR